MCAPPTDYDGLCAAADLASMSAQAKEVLLSLPLAYFDLCCLLCLARNLHGSVEHRGRVHVHVSRILMAVRKSGRHMEEVFVSRLPNTTACAGCAFGCSSVCTLVIGFD